MWVGATVEIRCERQQMEQGLRFQRRYRTCRSPHPLARSVAAAAHPGGGRCCVGGWAGDQATRAFHNLTGRRCLPRRLAWWKVRTAPRMPRTRIRCRSQMARSGRRYGYIIVSKHPLPHHHTSRQQGQVERSPGRAMSYATWKVQRHRQKQQESDEETARLWLERLLQQDLGTRAPWLAARARARQLRVRGGWDAWLLMRSHRPLGVCLFCASGIRCSGSGLAAVSERWHGAVSLHQLVAPRVDQSRLQVEYVWVSVRAPRVVPFW